MNAKTKRNLILVIIFVGVFGAIVYGISLAASSKRFSEGYADRCYVFVISRDAWEDNTQLLDATGTLTVFEGGEEVRKEKIPFSELDNAKYRKLYEAGAALSVTATRKAGPKRNFGEPAAVRLVGYKTYAEFDAAGRKTRERRLKEAMEKLARVRRDFLAPADLPCTCVYALDVSDGVTADFGENVQLQVKEDLKSLGATCPEPKLKFYLIGDLGNIADRKPDGFEESLAWFTKQRGPLKKTSLFSSIAAILEDVADAPRVRLVLWTDGKQHNRSFSVYRNPGIYGTEGSQEFNEAFNLEDFKNNLPKMDVELRPLPPKADGDLEESYILRQRMAKVFEASGVARVKAKRSLGSAASMEEGGK